MVTIILEGALFIAVAAMLAALVAYGVLELTPAGRRLRQTANRRRLEQVATQSCAVHGFVDERDLVRLPTGERICPRCYAEALDVDPQ
jgi:hypothetical protein